MFPLMRRLRNRRRGATIVETAVMAPVVIAAMLGMTELAYSYMIRQTVTNAAREGARAATLPGATMQSVMEAVDETMGAASLTGYSAESNVDELQPGDTEAWCEVRIPFDRASFTGGFFGGGSFTIRSRSTMRVEGAEWPEEE
jgi:hypothetical protein